MTGQALGGEVKGETGKRDPRGPRLTRVVLRNYRSIAACDVTLGQLTYLVGPNGSGKSNFLDALRLVSEALRTSLDHALRDRGGVSEVRRRSSGHPTNFGVRLEFVVGDDRPARFSFEVGARAGGVVQREECQVGRERYLIEDGEVKIAPAPVHPPAADDRLYLVHASGLPAFRPAYDLLATMGFYNLTPDRIRALQPADKGELLARDGSNLASVLDRLGRGGGGQTKERIEEYLQKIVPGVEGVDRIAVGHMETLEFRQHVEGSTHPWRFQAIHMSDGTLRALGVLVALFQGLGEHAVPVIGIEEPESALHPAAAGLLRDALREAGRHVQVLVTSHSPDLLDDAEITDDQVYAVEARDGTSAIARLDAVSRSSLRDRLYSAGELLRLGQLAPDLGLVPEPGQLRLFEPERP